MKTVKTYPKNIGADERMRAYRYFCFNCCKTLGIQTNGIVQNDWICQRCKKPNAYFFDIARGDLSDEELDRIMKKEFVKKPKKTDYQIILDYLETLDRVLDMNIKLIARVGEGLRRLNNL